MGFASFLYTLFYKEKGVKKVYFLNVFLVLLIILSLAGCKKTYKPETKEELKVLVDNKSISLGDINTSKITDMSGLFYESQRDNYTGIESWDVSNVTDMSKMFEYARSFNQDISRWDVSNVKNMRKMFYGAKSFNQPIVSWDVSNVTDMSFMLAVAESFNQDISKWNVSNVENMQAIFIFSPLENNPPAWYREQMIFSPF